MNLHNSSNSEENLDTILSSLAEKPSEGVVAASFSQTMQLVTKAENKRILVKPHKEEKIISPYLMQLHTKVSLLAGTLVVVLIVGYMSINRTAPYLDLELEQAALEEQSEYELTAPEDDFGDLGEDYLEEDPSLFGSTDGGGTSATTPSSPTSPITTDVSAELSVLDSIFASDDIDDAALEDWVTDTSATDQLTNEYDF